jgi:hypothetical protein
MPQDPFAAFAVQGDDPFAAFAEGKPPKTTYANEPTTYGEGFKKSLTNTAMRTGGGILSGAARMLDPRTYLSSDGIEHERMRAEASGERAPSTDYGMGDVRAMGQSLTTPEGGGEAIGSLLMGMTGPRLMTGARNTAAKIPTGRIGNAAWEGVKKGAAKVPVVGAPVSAGVRGAQQAWKASAPAAEAAAAETAPLAAEPAVMHGPTPKPKLSASETAAYLRKEYGSEKAGRMLYGKGKGDHIPPAERQAAIKRLSPEMESALPQSVKDQMYARLQAESGQGAFDYAAQAPNARAQSYLGDQLKAALLARMKPQ